MNTLQFTAALCSKVLHDLAGPAGAVFNGAELLTERSDRLPHADLVDLLMTSAGQLNVILRAYRLALGSLSSADAIAVEQEIRPAVEDYAKGRGFRVAWHGTAKTLHKDLMRILLSGVFILGDAVRQGGELIVDVGGGLMDPISVAARSAPVRLNREALAACLGQGDQAVTALSVLGFYAAAVAQSLGGRLTVEERPDEVKLGVVFATRPL